MGCTATILICLALAASETEGQALIPDETAITSPQLRTPLDLTAPRGAVFDASVVSAQVTIDAQGEVVRVESHALLNVGLEWLLARLLRLRFEPARYDGTPIAVSMPIEFELQSSLPFVSTSWEILEEGSGAPLAGIEVYVTDGRQILGRGVTDAKGLVVISFRESDSVQVIVEGSGYLKLRASFDVTDDVSQTYKVFLAPSVGPGEYQQIVRGKRRKSGSRLVFTGREMRRVAGALSDPFRALNTLPGLSSVSALIPTPVTRGMGPNHMAIWIDGFPAPMVFHSLIGPSVIYPEFLQDIAYESGDVGAEFGGQLGGVVSARTGFDSMSQRNAVEATANLAHSGVMGRYKSNNQVLLGSARIGYPSYLIKLSGEQLDVSYWDYHSQWSATTEHHKQRLALYGAGDYYQSPLSRGPLRLQFHRLLYQFQRRGFVLSTMSELSMTTLPDQPEELVTTAFGLNSSYRWSLMDSLVAEIGVQSKISYDDVDVNEGAVADIIDEFEGTTNPNGPNGEEPLTLPEEDFLKDAEAWRGSHAAYLELELDLEQQLGLVVAPGLRYSFVHQRETSLDAWDARVRLRQKIFEGGSASVFLKASTGLFSQPPRVPTILPGLDFGLLNLGMQRSWQSTLGVSVEHGLWDYRMTAFLNEMNNLSLDWGMIDENGDIPVAVDGRAYGVEWMVRRARAHGVFGWLSYSWSRGLRNWGKGWRWFALDREHVANAVVGFEMPRGWAISTRLLYQSGGPKKPELYSLDATPRRPGFFRVDIRFDRRVIFDEWLIEYHVDLGNALVSEESLTASGADPIAYILPMLGVTVRF